ncbi:hypothetical protein DFH06DRAFT_1387977 [Mycena polygramma]|nr:hypothetical protein DFH06DRAFT_1387977 [Mycena polygramma]
MTRMDRESRNAKEDKAVDEAIAAHPDDEPAQIDAIAAIRGYFRGDEDSIPTQVVAAYMAGDTSVEDAVRQLSKPVERSYSTGNGGRLLLSEELTARNQRTYHAPAAALEMWGPEEDLDALQAAVTDADDAPTTEGQLWDLYYSILHAAKKTPWHDAAAQQRLVDLTKALKARSNPPQPVRMTIPASRNWVWAGGAGLWSNQVMFGPSARETWNDSPGCGAGWRAPEVRAWTNVNAFVARLTARGVRDFRLYGMALEDEIAIGGHHHADSVDQMAEGLFETAAVWVRLAGSYIHGRLQEESSDNESVPSAQWNKWRQRFSEEADKGRYTPTATDIARECAGLMAKIGDGVREDDN